jgi:hypothetical protein
MQTVKTKKVTLQGIKTLVIRKSLDTTVYTQLSKATLRGKEHVVISGQSPNTTSLIVGSISMSTISIGPPDTSDATPPPQETKAKILGEQVRIHGKKKEETLKKAEELQEAEIIYLPDNIACSIINCREIIFENNLLFASLHIENTFIVFVKQ